MGVPRGGLHRVRMRNSNRPGITLLEMLITLSVIAVLMSIALPKFHKSIDILAVRAARESAFGSFSRARMIAQQHGGAAIELNSIEDRITVRTPAGAIVNEELFAPQDVDLELDGADSVTLRYDGYGLGRMMSRTLSLRARSAQAGLTISSFGRVRRW
jgi:prepilin-type N-terminal cleavage/methylation domain-containing protein